jgi:hypothetical protein
MGKDYLYLNRNCTLCQDHFDDQQFMNSKKDKLKWNAVPTIFNFPHLASASVTKKPRKAPKDRQQSQRQDDNEIFENDENQEVLPESPPAEAQVIFFIALLQS